MRIQSQSLAIAPALLLLAGCQGPASAGSPQLQTQDAGEPAVPAAEGALSRSRPEAGARPTELFDIVKVIDGDTVHIERKGELVKLRLLSVDTEERLLGNRGGSPSKPETVFGEECALWAQKFFEGLAEEGEPAQVGLRFPNGVERNDVFGRLLCHVILADGTDFNLLLVREGKSPYFNKYGNSLVCHTAFVAAQEAARAAGLGIWDPATNRPKTPGAPAAKRPYAKLLPWWQMRADAIEDFRAKSDANPDAWVDAESPEDLVQAVARKEPVNVFGQIFRVFDEDDGSRTVLFRSGEKRRALRVRIHAEDRDAHADLDLETPQAEFQQNYLIVHGRIFETPRGFELRSHSARQWMRAGS